MSHRFLTLLLAVALAASAMLQPAAEAEAPPGIEATDAWIRWLPAGLPAGGYVTLHNRSRRPQLLIGAASPAYATVTLHRMSEQGGVSHMAPVSQIELPPGASVSFAASGYHLMLEQATKPLQPGDRVPVKLRFAGGSTLTVDFELRRPDSATPQ